MTVTHPDIERYFMTIPEASQLVLQAASIGNGGEVFVLDIGESVRVVDLARDLIRLSGFEESDIEIKFTGLRPGEKLFEELYFDDEEKISSSHNKVFCALHRPVDPEELQATLDDLKKCLSEPPETVRQTLKSLVPEFGKETLRSLAGNAFYDRLSANRRVHERPPDCV